MAAIIIFIAALAVLFSLLMLHAVITEGVKYNFRRGFKGLRARHFLLPPMVAGMSFLLFRFISEHSQWSARPMGPVPDFDNFGLAMVLALSFLFMFTVLALGGRSAEHSHRMVTDASKTTNTKLFVKSVVTVMFAVVVGLNVITGLWIAFVWFAPAALSRYLLGRAQRREFTERVKNDLSPLAVAVSQDFSAKANRRAKTAREEALLLEVQGIIQPYYQAFYLYLLAGMVLAILVDTLAL